MPLAVKVSREHLAAVLTNLGRVVGLLASRLMSLDLVLPPGQGHGITLQEPLANGTDKVAHGTTFEHMILHAGLALEHLRAGRTMH